MKPIRKYQLALFVAALVIFALAYAAARLLVASGLPDIVAGVLVLVTAFALLWQARRMIGSHFFGVDLE